MQPLFVSDFAFAHWYFIIFYHKSNLNCLSSLVIKLLIKAYEDIDNNYFKLFRYKAMFKIKIQLFYLHLPLDMHQPLIIKLRKQHWHYILIDQITSPVLSTQHQFILREQQQTDTCFQLQLILKTQPQKGKIVGSSVINVKEWPMERSKRDKISLNPFIWLDMSISYEYLIPKTPSNSQLDVQLLQIEYQQQVREKQQLNRFIKQSNLNLAVQRQQLQSRNEQLLKKKQQMADRLRELEQQHKQARRRIQADKNMIENYLIEAKLAVTNLVNIVNASGAVDVIQEMNNFLVNHLS